MKLARGAAALTVAGILLGTLVGCSLDTVIWGADGARVIETTEQLIQATASDGDQSFACSDSKADLGSSEDWEGLSAGEPERFSGDHWPEQADLEPAWSINLELGASGATAGKVFPGDVFFRETDDGLCVIDIVWSTVEG